ncbi:MAG: hypothetical protein ACETWR_00755 [Anaerolineae bacterium]
MEDRIYSQVFAHRLEADYKDEAQFGEEKGPIISWMTPSALARLGKYLKSVTAIE